MKRKVSNKGKSFGYYRVHGNSVRADFLQATSRKANRVESLKLTRKQLQPKIESKGNETKKGNGRATTTRGSFDVAEEGDAAQRPVARVDVGLEVDGADVGAGVAHRLAVDGALVHARVLAGRRLHGVDVHHRHQVVERLRLGLDQLARPPVQRRSWTPTTKVNQLPTGNTNPHARWQQLTYSVTTR